ncbi:MAG: 30S ribosomal protein S3 [Clostridia bacterium]|nr:30S ribosomal protein S3 [Clostridia bacterium]
MGQKVNPIGFRTGINKPWQSQWTANKADFSKFLLEDHNIRKLIKTKYYESNVSKITIERTDSRLVVTLLTSRPGVLIGVKGAGVELIKKEIAKITSAKSITVNIREVKRPDLDATLVAESVAAQIAKRIAWKRAVNQAIMRAMKAGAKGIKIMASGRLNGAEIASSQFYTEGSIPLHTLRADIDYGVASSHTTFGVVGIKVWIYKGEVLGKQSLIVSEQQNDNRGGRN